MSRPRGGLAVVIGAVLAVGAVGAAPPVASAGWLGVRNDTMVAVAFKDAPAEGGQKQNRSRTLYPGEVSWEAVVQAGKRAVIVFDPKNPRRIYYQGFVTCTGGDQLYSIQLDRAGRCRLVPARLPKVIPGRRMR